MPSQATITSVTGPARTVTSQVLSNLTEFNLQLGGKSVLMTVADGKRQEFDIAATDTLTCTIADGVATIVVSQ